MIKQKYKYFKIPSKIPASEIYKDVVFLISDDMNHLPVT